jgi:cyanuric acid amidohydrolase
MTRRGFVHRIAARALDDVSALTAARRAGEIDPDDIVASFGKTEENGCVNDFSRGLASRAIKDALEAFRSRDSGKSVGLVMSGGTEGDLTPHIVVFEARKVEEQPNPNALAIGRARTPHLPCEHLGRLAQIDSVAQDVRAPVRDAGISDPEHVHFVQIKCPSLTAGRVADTERRRSAVATRDTLKSTRLSRAASALGVAVALGTIDRRRQSEESIGRDWTMYSSSVSASAENELIAHEIVGLGSAEGWSGPLRVEHCVTQDAMDVEPVREVRASLGSKSPGQFAIGDRGRMIASLAKAEASASGSIRGFRHTMLKDLDISSTRHAGAFVAGALASLVGHGDIYVSGGAEHQGPEDGGPIAIIVHCSSPFEGAHP